MGRNSPTWDKSLHGPLISGFYGSYSQIKERWLRDPVSNHISPHTQRSRPFGPLISIRDLAFLLWQPWLGHAFAVVKNSSALCPFPTWWQIICTTIYTFPGHHELLSYEGKEARLHSLLFLSGSIRCLPGLKHMERVQCSVWGWGSRVWSLFQYLCLFVILTPILVCFRHFPDAEHCLCQSLR